MSPNLPFPGSFPIPDDFEVLSCWGAHYSCGCGHLNSIMIPLPYFALPPWYCHVIRSPQNSFCQPDQWSKWFLKCLNGCPSSRFSIFPEEFLISDKQSAGFVVTFLTGAFLPQLLSYSSQSLDSSELEAGEHWKRLQAFILLSWSVSWQS